MGWGIIGGAAVKQYNEQAKTSREAEWDDLRKKEYLRQLAQMQELDDIANGKAGDAPAAGIPMAPVPDAPTAPAPQQGGGLRMPSGPAPLDASLAGAPAVQQQPPNVPSAPAAPSPNPAPAKQPRMSDQLFSQANAYMSSTKGGAKAKEMGMNFYEKAIEMSKHEAEKDITDILRAPVTGAQKIQGLLNFINGSDKIPGEATIEKRQDGLYMIHSAPGKEQPFAMKLEGNSEDAVIAKLALQARAMHNSALQVQLMTHDETHRHNVRLEDNRDERVANQMELGMAKLDMAARVAELQGQARAMGIDLKRAQAEAIIEQKQQALDLKERQGWHEYGTEDATGNLVFVNNQGETKSVSMPKGVTPFNKVTGNARGGAGGAGSGLKLPATMTDYEAKLIPMAKQELPDKPTPADKLRVARKYDLDPVWFGVTPPPAATTLGDMAEGNKPKAGKGLQPAAPPVDPFVAAKKQLDAARIAASHSQNKGYYTPENQALLRAEAEYNNLAKERAQQAKGAESKSAYKKAVVQSLEAQARVWSKQNGGKPIPAAMQAAIDRAKAAL